jgi:hypothetical protein
MEGVQEKHPFNLRGQALRRGRSASEHAAYDSHPDMADIDRRIPFQLGDDVPFSTARLTSWSSFRFQAKFTQTEAASIEPPQWGRGSGKPNRA